MKKINFIKFTLDIVMGIIFALLFNRNVLGGLSFHEIAGLAIGFAVLVHIALNWKWVKNVTLSIFNRRIALKTRIGYVLNILLLLDMAVIIISGILISKVLFPTLRIQSSFFNQGTHIASSYIALSLIGIHLGLHWTWVMNVFKKIIKVNHENRIFRSIARVMAVLALAFGIYSMVSTNYFLNTTQIFRIGSLAPFEHKMEGRPDFQFQEPAQNNDDSADNQFQGGNDSNINSKEIPQNFRHDRGMGEGKGRGNVSIPSLLASNLSIMGVFTILAYYIEKLLLRRKAK